MKISGTSFMPINFMDDLLFYKNDKGKQQVCGKVIYNKIPDRSGGLWET